MKKLGIATIAATGFAAALVGLAAPAQAAIAPAPAGISSIVIPAGIDHQQWVDRIQPRVQTPPAPVVGSGR